MIRSRNCWVRLRDDLKISVTTERNAKWSTQRPDPVKKDGRALIDPNQQPTLNPYVSIIITQIYDTSKSRYRFSTGFGCDVIDGYYTKQSKTLVECFPEEFLVSRDCCENRQMANSLWIQNVNEILRPFKDGLHLSMMKGIQIRLNYRLSSVLHVMSLFDFMTRSNTVFPFSLCFLETQSITFLQISEAKVSSVHLTFALLCEHVIHSLFPWRKVFAE